MENNMSPLSDLKVLDLSQIIAGPYCTRVLADLGAEMIEAEKAVKGDDSREIGSNVNGESALFAHINRNKQGIVVNLKDSHFLARGMMVSGETQGSKSIDDVSVRRMFART